MKAGDLRQIFDVEEPAEVRTLAGGVTVDTSHPWKPFLVGARGNFIPESGLERIFGGEFMAERTHGIVTRYIPGLNERMRINYKTDAQRVAGQDGRVFDILLVRDIEEDGRRGETHRRMALLCREAARSKGI